MGGWGSSRWGYYEGLGSTINVEFQTGWCATDLGDYRPCRGTYEQNPYGSIPTLDASRFTGAFDWIDDQGEIDPEAVAKMEDLNRQLAAVGLVLPADFVTFQTLTELSEILDAVSVTCCWSSLYPVPPSLGRASFDSLPTSRTALCGISIYASPAKPSWFTHTTAWKTCPPERRHPPRSSGVRPPSSSSPTGSGSRTDSGRP